MQVFLREKTNKIHNRLIYIIFPCFPKIFTYTLHSTPYTLHLLELLPECGIVLVVFGLFRGGGIVFDEPGEVFGIVDFVVEHLFAAGGEDGLALIGWHGYEGFNGVIEGIGAARLQCAIVATDGAVFCSWRSMNSIAELIDIF